MDQIDDFSLSPPSLKEKLKNSLCFSCCFPHRRPPPPPPPSSSDVNPAVIWANNEEPNNLSNLKEKVLNVLNFVGNGSNRHKRHSSTEFRYDPMSYSLNFEDGFDDDDDEVAPLRNFSSRLPPSPPVKAMPVREVAAAANSKQEIKIPNFYGDSSSSSPTGYCPCNCLKFSCFNWGESHEVHSRSLLQDETEHRGEPWLVIKMKTLRSLLRKVYRNSKKSKTQFQYDAQSYALNFDDGARREDDGLLCNFSSRFAVPAIGQKQSKNGL